MYDIAASPVRPPGHPSTYHNLPVQSMFARKEYRHQATPPVYYSCIRRKRSIETLVEEQRSNIIMFRPRRQRSYDVPYWRAERAS